MLIITEMSASIVYLAVLFKSVELFYIKFQNFLVVQPPFDMVVYVHWSHSDWSACEYQVAGF